MAQTVYEILSNRFNKDEFVSFLSANPNQFNDAFKLALKTETPQSWRAAWALNHCLSKKDERITPFVNKIIDHINIVPDGHQRELLKLLEHAKIEQDLEGKLFDVCATIWESVSKTPSARIVAFRILITIAIKYPELRNEIEFLTQNQYIEGLSPGIKNSLLKQIKKFNKAS